MLKAVVTFVIGSAITVVFALAMLYFLGQTTRLGCRHTEPQQVSCSVSNVALGLVPLPSWQLDQVVKADVEADCSDGCTYHTRLITRGGQTRPISEVWTDQEAQDDALAARINAFIPATTPELVVTQAPAAWVIWLIVGLGLMSLVIQGIVFLTQLARGLFARR